MELGFSGRSEEREEERSLLKRTMGMGESRLANVLPLVSSIVEVEFERGCNNVVALY